MQSTTNYSMNILEGTDIVNVPVQLNPNFQTIDSEMFKNKQAGIGTATEVVTGTVHAVVRNNHDADVFRFTATGAWASGDTMTLDGSAVTVHMADGTAPSAGAYIIGAEVVAVVNGTLVTLLTSNGAIDPGVTSFNDRTGAVSPTASDYDASMIDYDNTGSGLTATDVQSAIDEIANSGDNRTVLYTNPDSTVAMTTGTLQLSDTIANYSEIAILFRVHSTVPGQAEFKAHVNLGATALKQAQVWLDGTHWYIFGRTITISGDTLTYAAGKSGYDGGAISDDTGAFIIEKVYGIA